MKTDLPSHTAQNEVELYLAREGLFTVRKLWWHGLTKLKFIGICFSLVEDHTPETAHCGKPLPGRRVALAAVSGASAVLCKN